MRIPYVHPNSIQSVLLRIYHSNRDRSPPRVPPCRELANGTPGGLDGPIPKEQGEVQSISRTNRASFYFNRTAWSGLRLLVGARESPKHGINREKCN